MRYASSERDLLGWLSEAWGIDTTEWEERAALEAKKRKAEGKEAALRARRAEGKRHWRVVLGILALLTLASIAMALIHTWR